MTGWLHERERLEDALYVVGFFLLGVLLYLIVPEVAVRWNDGPEPPPWALLGLLAVAALGHTQRRVRPVLGLAIACGVLLAMVQLGSVPLAMMMLIGDLLYCSVLYSSERLSWTVAGATVAVAGGAGLVSLVSDGGRAAVLVILNLGLVLAVPVLWGREVRLHRGQADAERERAEQASRMSELDRAAAVAAERARMARDLHDVIAGQLSGIAIQSEAALNLPDPDPAVLRRVLQSVRRDSVASLAEMRTMIGLLRADGAGDGDPRTAPAGLDRLDALVESAGGTGLRIEVDDARRGAAELPVAVDLAAFRIVQEALTNAAKHAPRSRVRLHLAIRTGSPPHNSTAQLPAGRTGEPAEYTRYEARSAGTPSGNLDPPIYAPDFRSGSLDDHDGELVIEIENDLVPGAPAGGGTGTGLVGLHERADAVGGTVAAGPDGGRWRVRAVLPVPAAAGAPR